MPHPSRRFPLRRPLPRRSIAFNRSRSTQRTAIVLAATLGLLTAATARAEPTDAAIDATVQKALDAWHVPGVAVAIVRDGEVIYLKGHGVRSLDADDPVTPDTAFPHRLLHQGVHHHRDGHAGGRRQNGLGRPRPQAPFLLPSRRPAGRQGSHACATWSVTAPAWPTTTCSGIGRRGRRRRSSAGPACCRSTSRSARASSTSPPCSPRPAWPSPRRRISRGRTSCRNGCSTRWT